MKIDNLFDLCEQAVAAADTLALAAKQAISALIVRDGRVDRGLLHQHQAPAHGFAWFTTYVEAIRQLITWARALDTNGRYGELEQLILQVGFGEYLSQLSGGIPMSQNEMVRPSEMGVGSDAIDAYTSNSAVKALQARGNTESARARIAELVADSVATGAFGDTGLDDVMQMIRNQFRRFAEDEVASVAHEWHLKDELIPDEVIRHMGELGVFGLTIPEEYGGSGMGKLAMCVVSEELSRGYIGVGSLGTRSEIAAELILNGGTDEQKQQWLPKIATGEILPTAVFTEPNTGSDLGSLRTRAVKDGDTYKITGNKTWITHAARTDVMTLLARTDPDTKDYRGLSMFLAEKPRRTETEDFPAEGMTGSEIEVLGYRGMKEYELGFDGFEVKAENLLGQEEGNGFKQLMTTFESARIQTAARAIGVAQCALELGLKYAQDRVQFARPIYEFPRVFGKLAFMVVEIMIARQLSYFAAHQKDAGFRCDLEAGMAKLLSARIAWSCADNALQIHGGNGYALEYPISRVLCDARILNIFEGAAEIQAEVITRRLMESN